MDDDDDIDDVVDPNGPPPWIHLLNQAQRDWRSTQILRGRDPDTHIERELKRSGRWPPKIIKKAKKATKAKKAKKATKHAKRPKRRKTSR
jgi:hypothetical protein